MNWPDERYVRLYTRETAEWRAFCWQAKATFPLMMMHADRAGIVAVRPGPQRTRLVAGLIGLPIEVVESGIADLLLDGCLVEVSAGYVIRNFIEAQEAQASDAQRMRELRAREREKELARELLLSVANPPTLNSGPAIPNEVFAERTERSPAHATVTPSLAVPSRAVPDLALAQNATARPEQGQLTVLDRRRKPRAPKEAKPPNPRHAPLKAKMLEAFSEVTGVGYGFQGGKDAKGIDELLGICSDDGEILFRWREAWRRAGFDRPTDILDFSKKWNRYALPQNQLRVDPIRADPNGGILRGAS